MRHFVSKDTRVFIATVLLVGAPIFVWRAVAQEKAQMRPVEEVDAEADAAVWAARRAQQENKRAQRRSDTQSRLAGVADATLQLAKEEAAARERARIAAERARQQQLAAAQLAAAKAAAQKKKKKSRKSRAS